MFRTPFHIIENAAHDGAFGQNSTPEPSEAQRRVGNYKMGQVSLYGLNLAIEQPRGSTRSGVDEKTGKPWSSRMAAHYGYINGTKGNDGDCVDCFIGFDTQSERVYIINQNVGGGFDEHKVMLAFPDMASARRAYLDSYERGWDGLESIVPTSISQLKWWLKNGDMSRPLHPETLPNEGSETMTKKTHWNSDALPESATLDQVLYEIRRSDGGAGLLLDSVSVADIIEDAEEVLTFDALVSPYARLERKMELLRGVMERAGDKVKPIAMQITDPFKQRGVAQVAVIFELSDGQTVSIYFHNPDVTPNKMAAADEVISWKWLLNKKDITIVVAPERGADLNIREVARRIMRLAEKNRGGVGGGGGGGTERMQSIKSLKEEIAELETELAAVQHELEVAQVEAEARATSPAPKWNHGEVIDTFPLNDGRIYSIKYVAGGFFDVCDENGKALSQWASLEDAKIATNEAVFNENLKLEAAAANVQQKTDITYRNSTDGLFTSFFPNTPEGENAWNIINATPGTEGGKVLAAHAEPTIVQLREAGYTVAEDTRPATTPEEDEALLKELGEGGAIAEQDKKSSPWWEGSFGEKYAAVYLLGKSRGNDYLTLTEQSGAYLAHVKNGGLGRERVGNPAEIVEWLRSDVFVSMGDALSGKSLTLDDVRSKLKLVKGDDILFSKAVDQDETQNLIDAYVQSFSEAATLLNAAVAGVNWDGIIDTATMRAELDKLGVASRTGQHEIIGKASQALEAVGIKTWDERLSGVRNEPGVAAWNAALDASKDANNKIQDVAKERLIANGEAEVAALTEDSPLASVATAVFHKAGIETGDKVPGIVAAIEAKDADLAWNILRTLDNKASSEIFERATGIKLAKRQRERRPQIDEWAGITPEQRTELDAKRAEEGEAKRREDNLKWAWNGLNSISVRMTDGTVSNGQDFLKSLFDQGFDEIVVRKHGAAHTYYVRNAANQITGVKSKGFNGFLKAALAFGGLRQALEQLGVAEPKTEKSDAEKIAAVDESYRFARATDEFKLWLSESVLKGDHSTFVTAKGMDEAAKRHGAEIEWGEFASAALDDAGTDIEAEVAAGIKEAIATLTDGDYELNEAETGSVFEVESALDSAAGFEVETEVRAVAATKDLLNDFGAFLASDAKFATALDSVREIATFDSALVPLRSVMSFGMSLSGVEMTQDETERMEAFQRNARAISDRLTGRSVNTGTLDGVGDDGYVGKVKKGDQVLGRIDIDDDGKAMVYVGEAGDERVKGSEGQPFMYSESDAPDMVEALFVAEETSAAAQTEAFVGPAKDRMDALKVLTDTGMNHWMSEGQNKAVIAGLMGEEWQFFADKMKELAGVIAAMPKTYDQDGKGDEAVVHLHYFRGAGDWYITEKDVKGTGTEQAFGLADLYGDGGELGYISIQELREVGVELDFHFSPKTLAQIKGRVSSPEGAGADGGQQQVAASEADHAQTAAEDQKVVDRALFQSVIDGTAPDILAPELADSLEAAFNRNQGDPELVAMFEQAVIAYQNAMTAATANLA